MTSIFDYLQSAFGSREMISPPYILAYIGIAWLVYVMRREQGGFGAWLFPKDIWLSKSTGVDVMLLLIGRVMSVLGLVARFAVTPLVAAQVAALFPGPDDQMARFAPLTLALMLWLMADFANYWNHRMYHRLRALWPLHAVHHSAQVLTPLTTYRQHPLGLLVSAAISSVIVGVLLGLLVGAFDPNASIAKIAGANAFLVVTNLTIANFHHSHIWISFGPVIERLVISPAQHHIHHSNKPRHYNKNYGQTLAVWDWMFGTLYLTKEREDLTFGLTDPADEPLMTQRLGPVLIDPLRRMLLPRR